jgi:phosphoribosylformimino-5-aminoimidazole carboxamide ribotide isomerase
MFRPCIDLRNGRVVQLVGGTLRDDGAGVHTNYESVQPASWYADLYRDDGLTGGHVISLGSGNEEAARSALAAWPGGLQYGGGVHLENAADWLDAGAAHVIVTSWLFQGDELDEARLAALTARVGRDRLVLDLSCRRTPDGAYRVMTDRWQTATRCFLNRQTLEHLARSCSEFLVHAVDVEGLCGGIDEELVVKLAEWSPLPVTYAGGARNLSDLERTDQLGRGRVDLTIGSALDLFGGTGVRYADAVAFNRSRHRQSLA